MSLRKLRVTFPALLLLTGALAWPLPAQQPVPRDDAFQRVSSKLICQCGCNYGLSFCPHLQCPSAPVMRAAIREHLDAGLSEKEVLDAVVARFGPAALAAPPAEGFNLTAWIMPFVAILLGLLVVSFVIRRWRARTAQPQPAPADPALLERYRKTINREMKRLEE